MELKRERKDVKKIGTGIILLILAITIAILSVKQIGTKNKVSRLIETQKNEEAQQIQLASEDKELIYNRASDAKIVLSESVTILAKLITENKNLIFDKDESSLISEQLVKIEKLSNSQFDDLNMKSSSAEVFESYKNMLNAYSKMGRFTISFAHGIDNKDVKSINTSVKELEDIISLLNKITE